jgi:octaprenyl-diphosphate synthase
VKISGNAPSHSLTKAELFQKAFYPVRDLLGDVEQRIAAQARAFDPGVESYVAYAIQSHGKRLRPALALLSAGATGPVTPEHADLAVIVELIHAATLIHDDILDGAEQRRGQPTANAKWGNAISVLLGDCLFAHALKLSTQFENNEIGRQIAAAASEVCSGEILQTQRRFDLQLSVPDYYRIIEMKTGALFAVACEMSAVLNHAPAPVALNLRNFGMRLGTAYQIYDDCLDIAGQEETAGKTLGSDLRKGKLTLPILHLLQHSVPEERQRLFETILRGAPEDLDTLVQLAIDAGALSAATSAAQKMLEEARQDLRCLAGSPHTEGLLYLVEALEFLLGSFQE